MESKEVIMPEASGNKRKRERITGFEEWGGYMAAKKEKLMGQFEARKPLQITDDNKSTQIFKGVAIFVNGYTRPPAEELKQLMLKHGGTYHFYHHSQRTTHIIATNLPDTKIRNLKDTDKVVRPEWIVDSIKANELLPYQDYLLYSPKSAFGQTTLNVTKTPSLTDHTINSEAKYVTSDDETIDLNVEVSHDTYDTEIKETFSSLTTEVKESGANDVPEIRHDSDGSASGLNITAAQLSNISESESSCSEKISKSVFSVKAGDPQFLSEFYSHSRLHHISTAGQDLKQYVQEIVHARKGKSFPGRERLRRAKAVHSPHDAQPSQVMLSENGNAACSISGKVVMHIDMDCFFVSVGLRKYPELKGQPVAVTHSRGGRGMPQQGSDIEYEADYYRKRFQQKIVAKDSVTEIETGESILRTVKAPNDYGSLSEIASCSYEARAAGLHNGMFLGKALRLCPNLKTIPYDFEGYTEVSKQLYDTIAEYSLDIEAVSCDELYVDCTELLEDTQELPLKFASVLRAEILEKTSCTASAGIGSNMLLARLATKVAKPNGQYFLPEVEVNDFMKKQKVEDLPGVGYIMASKLVHLGVITCEDLQLWCLEKLQKEFGPKNGQTLYDHCRGKEDREVTTQKERKSVSAEINYGIRFETEKDVQNFVNELAVEVHQRLKKIGKKGKAVTLKLKMRKEGAPKQTAKFMGHGVCDSISKSVLMKAATNDPVLIGNQCCLLIQGMKLNPEDYRGLGIQVGKLEPAADIEKSSKVMERFLSNVPSKRCNSENSSVLEHGDVLNIQPEDFKSSTETKKLNATLEHFLSGAASNNNLSESHSTSIEANQLDESVLNALPEDIRNEVLQMYGRKTETSPTKSKLLPNAKKSPAKVTGQTRGRKKKVAAKSPQKTLKIHFEKTNPHVAAVSHGSCGPVQSSSVKQPCKANLCGAIMIDEVRDLLKEWFGSMEVPIEDDTEHLKDYLLAVIEEKDLEKADLVLKYFYRLAGASNLLWKEAYLSVLSYVQQKMLQDFGYMLKAESDF